LASRYSYRRFKKTDTDERTERIEALADGLSLPREALSNRPELKQAWPATAPASQPFRDPDPFHQLAFANPIEAKLAIADRLGMALAKLPGEQIEALNALLAKTLVKAEIFAHVRAHIEPHLGR
jgi:hypothetical protein